MVTKSQKIRVITFVIVILLVFLYVIFVLIGQKLFTSEDTYYVKLQNQSATGLTIGQDVRYYGINIGKITDISINQDDISEIIVTFNVKEGTPIKNTVKANLNFIGITGLKIIELTGGENKDQNLTPGSYIKAEKSALDNITGKAEVISEKVEILINNLNHLTNQENRQKFEIIVDKMTNSMSSLDSIITTTNSVIQKNKGQFEKILANTNNLLINMDSTLAGVEMTLSYLNKFINTIQIEKIQKNIENITEKFDIEKINQVLNSSDQLLRQTNKTVTHIDKTFLKSRKKLLYTIELFKETLENLNEFTIMLRDNPDILIRGKSDE